MKNIYIYYITFITPLAIILLLIKADIISATWFAALLLLYAFPFRTYIDGKRLVAKNVIDKKDIWKTIITGQNIKYFKELYYK